MEAVEWEVRNGASLAYTTLLLRMLGVRNLAKVWAALTSRSRTEGQGSDILDLKQGSALVHHSAPFRGQLIFPIIIWDPKGGTTSHSLARYDATCGYRGVLS